MPEKTLDFEFTNETGSDVLSHTCTLQYTSGQTDEVIIQSNPSTLSKKSAIVPYEMICQVSTEHVGKKDKYNI